MAIAQFSGLASGIDSKSLIDAMVQAKEAINEKRKKDIEGFKSQTSSLEELRTKLLSLSDLIKPFSSVQAGGVQKKAASTDSSVATAAFGSNAGNSSYKLTVSSLAKSGTASFDQTFSSPTSAVSASGTGDVTITVGTGANQKTVSATVTQGVTTAQDLVKALNSDPDAAGRFNASLVNVGTTATPSYKIMFSSAQQGTDMGQLSVSTNAAVTELQGSSLDQAQNAVFQVSGLGGNITRSSNSVSDVIPGVTFNLANTGTATVSASNDAQGTADKVQAFVTAYNDIFSFVSKNDTVTQDENSTDGDNVFGSLAKTRIDNDFIAQFRSAMSGAAASNGSSVKKMSEMGISTNRDGTLAFDVDKFKSAVANDPSGVTGVLNSFADKMTSVNGTIYQFTKYQGSIDLGVRSNASQVDRINESISRVERQSASMRTSLERQFARLESVTAGMQQQQQALTSVLAGM